MGQGQEFKSPLRKDENTQCKSLWSDTGAGQNPVFGGIYTAFDGRSNPLVHLYAKEVDVPSVAGSGNLYVSVLCQPGGLQASGGAKTAIWAGEGGVKLRLVAGEGLANELSVYVDGKQVEFCIFADNLLGIALCIELPPLPFESRKYVVLEGRVEFRDQQGNLVTDRTPLSIEGLIAEEYTVQKFRDTTPEWVRKWFVKDNTSESPHLEIIELGGTTPPVYSQDEVKELHVEVLRKMDAIRKSATLVAPEEGVSWHFPQLLDPADYPMVVTPTNIPPPPPTREFIYGDETASISADSYQLLMTSIQRRGSLPGESRLYSTSPPVAASSPLESAQSVSEAGTTPCHYCRQPISPQDEQGAAEVDDTWLYFHRRCQPC